MRDYGFVMVSGDEADKLDSLMEQYPVDTPETDQEAFTDALRTRIQNEPKEVLVPLDATIEAFQQAVVVFKAKHPEAKVAPLADGRVDVWGAERGEHFNTQAEAVPFLLGIEQPFIVTRDILRFDTCVVNATSEQEAVAFAEAQDENLAWELGDDDADKYTADLQSESAALIERLRSVV
jgi:hypothetical protein